MASMNVCTAYPIVLKIGDFQNKDKTKRFNYFTFHYPGLIPSKATNVINFHYTANVHPG